MVRNIKHQHKQS